MLCIFQNGYHQFSKISFRNTYLQIALVNLVIWKLLHIRYVNTESVCNSMIYRLLFIIYIKTHGSESHDQVKWEQWPLPVCYLHVTLNSNRMHKTAGV